MRLFLPAATLALAALLTASPASAIVERCVDSVDEFEEAYELAREQPVRILLVTGTYPFWQFSQSILQVGIDEELEVIGGYNSTCTSRSLNPALTVIEAFSELTFSSNDADQHWENLSIRGVDNLDFYTNEAALSFVRVHLDDLLRITLKTGDLRIENSLFTRIRGLCSVGFLRTSELERVTITGSTFADNNTPALCISDDTGMPDWLLVLRNNIFWGNGSTDIRLNNPAVNTYRVLIQNNTYAGLSSDKPLSSAPTGTSGANPLFVDAAAGNYRLQGASPAINSGRIDANLVAQRDLDGNPRWFGQAPDRGAFETNIGSTNPVLTVTNTNDSGTGSLRQALIDANAASNLNTIRFNIAGACPRVITLSSLLPDIVHPLVIEGYSQPGASRNSAVSGWNATLCIVLEGNNQIGGAFGFNVNTSASPDATVSIEGIAFSGHSFAAAQFVGGRDHRFVGNQIGGVAGSRTLLASGTGVRIGSEVEGVRVGGPDPAERNVIASALGAGISITGGSGSIQPTRSVIQNNHIGTQSGGDLRGNERGIFVSGPDHLLRDNVIANSLSHGIELSGALATGNRILGNRIGIPALCFGSCVDRGNEGHGVLIRNSANGNRVESNQIAFNDLDGIAVTGARRNTLRRNTMYDQGGIGIDLGDDGRNLFDANNSVAAPVAAGNDSQNYPAISSVSGTPSVGSVTGTLNSANGWYRLDFYGIPESTDCTLVFSNGIPSGFFGEGRDWLGSTFVQISNASVGANGSASFSEVQIQRSGSSNYFVAGTTWIVATATRLSGPPLIGTYSHLGTSEFGRCRQYAAGAGPDRMFANGFEAASGP